MLDESSSKRCGVILTIQVAFHSRECPHGLDAVFCVAEVAKDLQELGAERISLVVFASIPMHTGETPQGVSSAWSDIEVCINF